MGVVAQERDWYPWDAVVASRAVLTAAQGLGARFHQAVSPRGAARSRGWRVVATAAGCGDLVKAVWLSRDPKPRIALRWLADAGDLALWCLAAGDDADTSEDAVIPGAALAVEAAARWGLPGAVVPLANAAVAAYVRGRRGHRLRLEQFSWQVMGTVGGLSLRLLAERRRRRLEAHLAAEREARLRRAELAGFHDVIVENEGALDLLQRALTLIELAAPGGEGLGSFAGAVKAAVAETARGQAAYLGDVLSAWQAEHNRRPDLAGLVQLDLGPGEGLLLLSQSQVDQLYARLDQLDLSGALAVGHEPQRMPFGACRLKVGEHDLYLDATEGMPRWVFDATPVAFLMGLGWLAQPAGAHREAVPWSVTAPPMLGFLAAALSWARREDSNRSVPPAASVAVSGLITFGYTVAATRTMRHPHSAEGISRFPWVMALQGYELIRGIPSEESGTRTRTFGLFGTAAIVAAGWWGSPEPRSGRALVAELGWVVAFDTYTWRLRRAMVESASHLTTTLAAQDDRLIAQAHRRGRDRASELMAEALDAARLELSERAAKLEPDVAAEAERRLERVSTVLRQTS